MCSVKKLSTKILGAALALSTLLRLGHERSLCLFGRVDRLAQCREPLGIQGKCHRMLHGRFRLAGVSARSQQAAQRGLHLQVPAVARKRQEVYQDCHLRCTAENFVPVPGIHQGKGGACTTELGCVGP